MAPVLSLSDDSGIYAYPIRITSVPTTDTATGDGPFRKVPVARPRLSARSESDVIIMVLGLEPENVFELAFETEGVAVRVWAVALRVADLVPSL